jgi:hypothetical protein
MAGRGADGVSGKRDPVATFMARRASAPKTPKDPLARPPVSEPEPAWPSGIVDSGQAPFAGSMFAFENQWQDVVAGEHASAYAGSLRDDPAQGIVALAFTALDVTGPASLGGIFRTPLKAGPVRIVAANGARLTLEAADGMHFVFDIVTRSFAVL